MSNNKFKVLIVEDEANICSFIETLLTTNDYQALVAHTCTMGLTLFASHNPDLVILDLGLPDRDGLEFIRTVRQKYMTPIVVLSARTDEMDKIEALDLGANDYITKPFAMRELMARVKANIRRVDMAPAQSAPPAGETEKRLELGRVSIDLDGATVFKDRKPLDLTQREYELIRFLASQPGKVFSREALMEHVWNYEGYVGDVRAVDVAVRRLREKLEDDPAAPKFILTKRGMGYLFGSQPG